MLGGFLWEQTGSLDATFYLMGVAMMGGAAFPVFLPLALASKDKKNGACAKKVAARE